MMEYHVKDSKWELYRIEYALLPRLKLKNF